MSARGALAFLGALMAVGAFVIAALGPYAPQGFAYKCVLPEGAVKAGYTGSPVVYYYYVHSVHKDIEVDVLEVTPRGFKPSIVYLRDFGAGTPEGVIGESQGFLVVEPAVDIVKPELVVASRGNPTVKLGAAGTWLAIETCSFIRLVPVAG